jgi:hypothetical protein
LEHHAPVDVEDDTFDMTPMGWELFAWSGRRDHWAADGYYEIVEQLLRAGARVEGEWLRQDGNASRLARRIDEDVRMRAILAGSL